MSVAELPRRSRPPLLAFRTLRADLVEVTDALGRLGYIEIVGETFIVRAGDDYDTAVEILQTTSIEVASASLSGDQPAI